MSNSAHGKYFFQEGEQLPQQVVSQLFEMNNQLNADARHQIQQGNMDGAVTGMWVLSLKKETKMQSTYNNNLPFWSTGVVIYFESWYVLNHFNFHRHILNQSDSKYIADPWQYILNLIYFESFQYFNSIDYFVTSPSLLQVYLKDQIS